MAKYRPIKTCLWDDDYVLSLKTDEKLLFLYLITNNYTTLCGIYALSIRYTEMATGIPSKRILDILKKLENDNKAIYRDGWIHVLNAKKHHSASPHIKTGIEREEAEIPQGVKDSLYPIDRVSQGMDKPILKLKPKLKLKKDPKGSSEQAPKVQYGNEDINNMLIALKGKLGLEDFSDSQKWGRIYARHCLGLIEKLGKDEFLHRLDSILADSFKRKNCNSIRYLYGQLKGFMKVDSDKFII